MHVTANVAAAHVRNSTNSDLITKENRINKNVAVQAAHREKNCMHQKVAANPKRGYF